VASVDPEYSAEVISVRLGPLLKGARLPARDLRHYRKNLRVIELPFGEEAEECVSNDAANNMTPEPAVEKSIEISASTSDVWRALTEPNKIAQWMGGTRVESKWEIDSDITFTGEMPNFNKTYRDRGTVLAIEREKLLKYSHWTELSRLPDAPENRTVITFSLDRIGTATRLTVRHENFYSAAAYKHANFFWGFALTDVKNMLEL
jgi:uncharacterized protein YndB with AHSA1/START domain